MTEAEGWNLGPCAKAVLRFRDARDWKQFHRPKDLAAALAIEAAELQELFLWQPPVDSATVRADSERMLRVREEIADCAIYLILLAHELDVDLSAAVTAKIAANEIRYPVGEHRSVARKAKRG